MRNIDHLFLLISIAISIKAGNSLKCFNCVSDEQSECKKITKNSPIKAEECRPNVMKQNSVQGGSWIREITKINFFETSEGITVAMACQKIVATDSKNEEVTFRGCQYEGAKNDFCQIAEGEAEKQGVKIVHCEICSEDECNKSSHLTISKLLILLITLIVVNSLH